MIYGKLEFGLGNQMFQYAFCRFLQTKYQEKAILDTSCGSAFGQYHARRPVEVLRDLNINEEWITLQDNADAVWSNCRIRWRILAFQEKAMKVIPKLLYSKDLYYKMQCYAQRLLNRFGMYSMQYGPMPLLYSEKFKDILFCGNFITSFYADEIRDLLLKEFAVITPINEKNQHYLDMIEQEDAVCVHVRRGDFTAKRYAMLNVCGKHYYNTAVDRMLEIRPNARFFVFSNDLKWVQENIDFHGREVYVDANPSSAPADELRLMKSCKAFIIANSSFSWWAQYLSEEKEKTVIGPKHFHVPGGNNGIVSKAYQMPDWILVDNEADCAVKP